MLDNGQVVLLAEDIKTEEIVGFLSAIICPARQFTKWKWKSRIIYGDQDIATLLDICDAVPLDQLQDNGECDLYFETIVVDPAPFREHDFYQRLSTPSLKKAFAGRIERVRDELIDALRRLLIEEKRQTITNVATLLVPAKYKNRESLLARSLAKKNNLRLAWEVEVKKDQPREQIWMEHGVYFQLANFLKKVKPYMPGIDAVSIGFGLFQLIRSWGK